MTNDTDGRRTTKSLKLTPKTKQRLDAHNRDEELLGGTIERALDALEREEAMPEAVRVALRNRADD
jgi:hypothetical protein